MIICCALMSVTYAADSIVVKESLTDVLKSSKTNGVTNYYLLTSGKFSVTAKISSSTLKDANLFLADITESSTIEISIGDFSFASTLSDASPHSLSTNNITAKWTGYHDGACKDANCTEYKQVKDITTSLAGNISGITFKIEGTSSAADSILTYGTRVFADTCDSAGTGTLKEVATITIDGISFTVDLNVTCSMKSKMVTPVKGGESFALFTTTIKAINTGSTGSTPSIAGIAGTWKTSQGKTFTISDSGVINNLVIDTPTEGWCFPSSSDFTPPLPSTIQISSTFSFSAEYVSGKNKYGEGYTTANIDGQFSSSSAAKINWSSSQQAVGFCGDYGEGSITASKVASLKKDNNGTFQVADTAPAGSTLTFKIGDTGPAGGIVFYIEGSGAHGLEVSRTDYITQPADYVYGANSFYTWSHAITGAGSFGSGWHLPSKDELNLLYQQKSVAGFSDYSDSYPFYWSSTESGSSTAWVQGFDGGAQSTTANKNDTNRVLAVRSF
jgi:hypothetical protein